MHGGKARGAPKGNSHAFKHGRYTAEHIAERRHFADLLREMKGFIDELDGKERSGALFNIRPARLGSSRRLAYAGGGSAGCSQRQTCEPGSHLGSRVRTRCNLAESVPVLLFVLTDEGFALRDG
jgi:hypothetical protein